MQKFAAATKTRRGNCLVLPHTGYALDARGGILDVVATRTTRSDAAARRYRV